MPSNLEKNLITGCTFVCKDVDKIGTFSSIVRKEADCFTELENGFSEAAGV